MVTQERLDTAKRRILRLRDEHASDMVTLARLVDGGGLKGGAQAGLSGGLLSGGLLEWDRAFGELVDQTLAMLDDLSGPAQGAGGFDR
ncbi:hypothetical protein [Nonomuraea candida]|uniref:hypothetical protein n=1 Tax=Nonomuraea candida TaxID=359159 RepID=UPI0005B7B6AE|nr:hypothetical protein [Nonomuraea candida]